MVSFKSTKEKVFFVGDLWDLTFTRIVNLLPSDSVVSVKILLILSIFLFIFKLPLKWMLVYYTLIFGFIIISMVLLSSWKRSAQVLCFFWGKLDRSVQTTHKHFWTTDNSRGVYLYLGTSNTSKLSTWRPTLTVLHSPYFQTSLLICLHSLRAPPPYTQSQGVTPPLLPRSESSSSLLFTLFIMNQ
jgi:hypothetical protein